MKLLILLFGIFQMALLGTAISDNNDSDAIFYENVNFKGIIFFLSLHKLIYASLKFKKN
jgi:hypothetical protein